ncbi:hypothetical protein WJ438_37270 [Streptomyces sp. GD-15H]
MLSTVADAASDRQVDHLLSQLPESCAELFGRPILS